jgi:hypothetical protein
VKRNIWYVFINKLAEPDRGFDIRIGVNRPNQANVPGLFPKWVMREKTATYCVSPQTRRTGRREFRSPER